MRRKINLGQLIAMLVSTAIGLIIYYLLSGDMSVFNDIFWVVYGALVLYFVWGEKIT